MPKIINQSSVMIDDSVTFGKNIIIYPNNIIKGKTIIGDNVTIMPNNYICDSIINNDSTIEFSYIENSEVGSNTHIGPYSRLRPNTKIGNNCKIGNFVEIKNSNIGDYCKASHLAYIGDCDIGKNCNIGCGVIFANYNGKIKNRSTVGNDCFIGSNANIIAPVKISDHSYICAGTTLTTNTDEYDFIIGRSRETIKKNYAKKYFKEQN